MQTRKPWGKLKANPTPEEWLPVSCLLESQQLLQLITARVRHARGFSCRISLSDVWWLRNAGRADKHGTYRYYLHILDR